MPALTLTPLSDIPLIQPGDDLAGIILSALGNADLALETGDILVLAQKIVSKAEGQLVNLATVEPTPAALKLSAQSGKDIRVAELILRESNAVLRVRPKAMTVAVILAGLVPIVWGTGTGSEVMSRIAAPMLGGMVTAPLLSLFIVPAVVALLRRPKRGSGL